MKIENDRIKIESLTMPFVPLNVYKCLVKIAFSLMENKDFKKFKTGVSWLLDKKSILEPKIPHTMLFNPNMKPVKEPIALLLKKKINYNSPEFSLLFFWGFYVFQIFPPFNSSDKNLDYSNIKLPIMSDFITKTKDGKFGVAHFDMNTLERIRTLEKINFKFKTK